MKLLSTLAAATLAGTLMFVPAPQADAAAKAAPGAPLRTLVLDGQDSITIDGQKFVIPREFNTASCSQGPTGTLRSPSGETYQIMVTAGHCVTALDESEPDLSEEVYVNTHSDGFEEIGTLDHVGQLTLNENAPLALFLTEFSNSTDWGTVRINEGVETSRLSDSRTHTGQRTGAPVVLTGIRDYRKIGPHEVAFDNAGQPICKDGYRSGRTCGVQIFRTSQGIWSWGMDYKQGDSGGINYDPRTREALGVTSLGLGPLGRAQPIDSAIEEGYGIPSGQVNQHFKLAESTQPHADFKTYRDEERELNAVLEDQGLEPMEYVDLNRDFRAAQRDARGAAAQNSADINAGVQAVGNAAATGNPAAVNQAVQELNATATAAGNNTRQHAENLAWLGIGAAIQDITGA